MQFICRNLLWRAYDTHVFGMHMIMINHACSKKKLSGGTQLEIERYIG